MNAAMNALDETHRRDPRQFPFGFFSSDFSLSGLGMFHWYPSLDDLFRALIRDVPPAFIVESPQAVAAASARIEAAAAVFSGDERLGTDCFEAVREALGRIQRLEWIGTFEDLCASDHEWPTSLRRRFRGDWSHEEDDDAADDDGQLDQPIAAHHLAQFVVFVSEFGY